MIGDLSVPASARVSVASAFYENITSADALRGALASSADFEKQLTDDGYVVVKFFVHVTKEAQRKRLTRLRRDPTTAWRVSDGKMATIGEYEEAYRLYDNLLEGSDFSYAPWHLINGEDKRRANLKITETLVDALEKALHAKKDPAALAAAAKAQANSSGAAVEEIPLEGRSPEQQLATAGAAPDFVDRGRNDACGRRIGGGAVADEWQVQAKGMHPARREASREVHV